MPVSHSGIEHIKIANLLLDLYSSNTVDFNANTTFIRPTSIFDMKERDHWREDLFPRTKTINVNMLSMGLNMSFHGHGAIFIPKILADYSNRLIQPSTRLKEIAIPEALKVTCPLFAIKRIGEPLSLSMKPILKRIIKLVQLEIN